MSPESTVRVTPPRHPTDTSHASPPRGPTPMATPTPSPASTPPPTPSEPDLLEAASAMTDAARHLGASVQQTVRIAERSFREVARDRPYVLLGAAVGTGFVVGGGLASPITRGLVGMGMRTAGAFLLDAALQTLTPPPEMSAPPAAEDTPNEPLPEEHRRRASSTSPSSTNAHDGVPHAPNAP